MDKDATLDVVEKSLDAIEDQLDAFEAASTEVVTVVKNNPVILAGVSVVGLAAGAVGGYYFAKKHLSDKLKLHYEAIAEQEIADAKKFYSTLRKAEFPTPADAVKERLGEEGLQEAVQAMLTYKGVTGPVETEEELVITEEVEVEEADAEEEEPDIAEIVEAEVSNVFQKQHVRDDHHFDYNDELEKRAKNPDQPYVISHDEFYNNDEDYEQVTLTYFEEDDVLADEKDDHIDDTEGLVGNANLLRFGHGSKDMNVVYVRNDSKEIDFEILRSNGSFAREVLGFIEHSDDDGGIRRFRNHEW